MNILLRKFLEPGKRPPSKRKRSKNYTMHLSYNRCSQLLVYCGFVHADSDLWS